MWYEWDEGKNLLNQEKHDGISFELAALVFEDPRCLAYPDRIDDETAELRWHPVGMAQIESEVGAVLLVVHCYREDNHGEEVIRIISARAAEKHEIRRYQEQAMD
jgi:uncharacterized DUF497 family protein